MPLLTAAQLQTDLAAIMADVPGAVVSVTINGTAYQAIDGGLSEQSQFDPIGEVPVATRRLLLSAASLSASAVTPRQTTATIGGHVYRIVGASTDPFGAWTMLTLGEVGNG